MGIDRAHTHAPHKTKNEKNREIKGTAGSLLCVFLRESVVNLDRRWYAREERRVQAVEEKVDVGQICETGECEERGFPVMASRRRRHPLEVGPCIGPFHTTHMLIGTVP